MAVFFLKVNHEEMVVTLQVVNNSPQGIETIDQLTAELNKNNVLNGIDFAAIADAFTNLPKLTNGAEIVIARGEPAINGKNGCIEFLVNVSGKPIYDGAKITDDTVLESVDYRNAMCIVSVAAGTRLAEIKPPTIGKIGKTLTGKDVAARDGKAVSLQLGEGTAFAADNPSIVVATLDGRPVYNGKSLTVSQTYEIADGVGLNTGNIKFDGYVVVHGGVQDGFSIEARNIEINGVVGAAKIICRENLIMHGGMNGRGTAQVVCYGNVDTKYLINCEKIEVGGNLNVAKEISNSTVWSRGTIRAGKIMGGEALALRGIEAKQFGSEIGAPTAIIAGIDYEFRRIDDTAKIFCNNIYKIINEFGVNFGNHKWFTGLAAERQEEINNQYKLFVKLKDAHQRLDKGKKKLQERGVGEPLSIVAALKILYNDVTVKTARCVRIFKETVHGPACFVEDVENHTVKIENYDKDPFAG